MDPISSSLLELLERADLRDKPPPVNAHHSDHHSDQSLTEELRSTTLPSEFDEDATIDILWFLETEDSLRAFLPAYPVGTLIYVQYEEGPWPSIVIPQWLYRLLKMGAKGHSEEIGNMAPSDALFVLTLGRHPAIDYLSPQSIESRVKKSPEKNRDNHTQNHLLAQAQADKYIGSYVANPDSHIGQFVLYQPGKVSARRWYTVKTIDISDPANPMIVLHDGNYTLRIPEGEWKYLRWIGPPPTQASDGVWSPYWDVAFDARVALLVYNIKQSTKKIDKIDLAKDNLKARIADLRQSGYSSRRLLRPSSTNPLEKALLQSYNMKRNKESLITERDGYIKDLVDIDPTALPNDVQHLIDQAIQLRFRLKMVDNSIGEALNLD